MATILCSECGESLTNDAPACPNCGCPREVSELGAPESSVARNSGRGVFQGFFHFFVTLPIALLVAGILVLTFAGTCAKVGAADKPNNASLPTKAAQLQPH